MPLVKANGIEIEYDALGDPANPPMLLIMGLGAQLITWDDGFCEALANRHFHVIRYDNRDAGLSTKMDDRGPSDVAAAYGGEAKPAYSLDDLADDAAGLLDALRIDKAHVVGASMGGMIAQLVAINHPERVLSLTSIMSAVGGADMVSPPVRSLWPLLLPLPKQREARIRRQVRVQRMLAGGNPIQEDAVLAFATAAVDRAYRPEGMRRQLG